MHPPNPGSFRQEVAYDIRRCCAGFAAGRWFRHGDATDPAQGNTSWPRRSQTPSPYCRSAPPGRGAGFAQVSAKSPAALEFSFPNRELRVYCDDITTTNHPRGRATCVSRPSFWRRQPCLPLQVVCRTPLRAGLRALRRARFWPTPPTTARLPAPSSAVWPVLPPAASTSGCLPATTIDLTAAQYAVCSVPTRLAGPFGPRQTFALLRRACGLRGESRRCSTRS